MKRSEAETWEWVEQRAAELWRTPTAAEQAIRADLLKMGFYFQVPMKLVGPRGRVKYEIFDFYHPKLKLAVEVDGSSHRHKQGSDSRRDRMALFCGIKTVRISNKEALKGDLARIKEAMDESAC